MKLLKTLSACLLLMSLMFAGCKPKDADIKSNIEKELKTNPATDDVMVMVDKGLVTLSGEVENDAAKAAMYDKVKGIKGVTEVQDNTVVPVPEAPVAITADDPLMVAVRDATKDYPEVTANVNDGVISVTGNITKDRWQKLKMTLDGLHPKKVDPAGLTVK